MIFSYKNIRLLILSFILIFDSLFNKTHAQRISKVYKPVIQRIDINNKFIRDCTHKFIQERKENDMIFKSGYGYISIRGIDYGNLGPVDVAITTKTERDSIFEAIVLSFRVSVSSVFLDDDENADGISGHYPPFYAYIDNVLVLIYLNDFHVLNAVSEEFAFAPSLSDFKEKSEKKLRRLMFPFLKRSLKEDFVFVGLDGKKFTVSKEERKKLTTRQILRRATFTLGYTKKYQLTRSNRIMEVELYKPD